MRNSVGIEEWQCYMFGHKWVEETNPYYHYIAQVCARCGEAGWGGHYSPSEGKILPQELSHKGDILRIIYKTF